MTEVNGSKKVTDTLLHSLWMHHGFRDVSWKAFLSGDLAYSTDLVVDYDWFHTHLIGDVRMGTCHRQQDEDSGCERMSSSQILSPFGGISSSQTPAAFTHLRPQIFTGFTLPVSVTCPSTRSRVSEGLPMPCAAATASSLQRRSAAMVLQRALGSR